MDRDIYVALLVLIAVVISAWLLSRPRRGRKDGNSAKERLLHLCLGDRKKMRRLIALERSRSPGVSRDEATARAVESLLRDGK